MINPFKLVEKAKYSAFYLTILNWSLDRMIPFNRPHGFRIVSMTDNAIKTKIPYKQKNFNHIRGLHACALATISEFTTGFLLITRLDGRKYRIIMKRIEIDYHYQGKMDAYAVFEISPDWLKEHIYEPLQNHDSTVVTCEVKIYDEQSHHLTTGKVFWQIKDWQTVKTKV